MDKVLVVDCREATQVARVMHRSGWTQATVERVIAQQATRAARRAIADAVIFNEGLTLDSSIPWYTACGRRGARTL